MAHKRWDQWDGKLHRPTRFGEGMRPGTVEWTQVQRQRSHERAYARAVRQRDAM